MMLVIDNYDSFTFNLVQYLGELGAELQVFRNDEISLEEIKKLNPVGIVISPGPGRPENAGISVDLIKEFYKEIPILGVCLGHQAIGYAFNGRIINAPILMHGKTSQIYYENSRLFHGLENPFVATRYHSLVIDRDTMPDELLITAETEDKVVMAVEHRDYPLYGVQFHPESILTSEGKKMLQNFINLCEQK